MNNTNEEDSLKNVPDLEVYGSQEWKTINKAWSHKQGFMNSTKAIEVPMVGCLIQVSRMQRRPDGSFDIAESLTFAPGVCIKEVAGPGDSVKRFLAPIQPCLVVKNDLDLDFNTIQPGPIVVSHE